jgi:hypothetical protein
VSPVPGARPLDKRFVNVIGTSTASPGHSRTSSPFVSPATIPPVQQLGLPPTTSSGSTPSSTGGGATVASPLTPDPTSSPAISSRSLRVDAIADPNDVALAMNNNIKSPHIQMDAPI